MQRGLDPIFNKDTRILILGSAPSEMSLKKQQYYGNNGNQFWKMMFAFFNVPFETDYDKRVALLLDHQIGLWDVYHLFEREGSLDTSIKTVELNDFSDILTKANIQLIITNGKKAYDEVLENNLFPDITVIPCISTSGAANGFMEKRRQQWYEALEMVR
ncbi:DNA-deoxyinosine glycosylase [Vagococcus bubulae]|uniref:DNA-deoxyinosine glycosylase n=1 Tax=Vagococcus bubulae TaxID=1977868 RepID=A0A429ZAB3_9ENTE|nr:DNA-deoxyinosine glycosylase [Vagococcus bubulae]RST90585.1 DNA-deoxyinosine glycosylase [Vagococcus bubulae]